MTEAGFCRTPTGAAAGTLAVKETETEPPPGMLKAPHEGEVAKAAGLLTVVRVAPPAVVTASVLATLRPAGSASASTAPVAVP